LKRRLPAPRTDAAAARFVAGADLTRYDLSAMTPVRFEFAPKEARVNMRMPGELLEAVKAAAEEARMPYQRFIRITLERAVASRVTASDRDVGPPRRPARSRARV
jgi:predicted DNA binding CopG/RHH family protein